MGMRWEDIRRGPAPEPLSEDERRVQMERLDRLNKFCEGMEPTAELLDLADRYRLGNISFEEFETQVLTSLPDNAGSDGGRPGQPGRTI